MRIEIDQSGKIENTNRPTVLAYSNSKSAVLIILSRDKKNIQKYFRQIGKPKLFVYFTFIMLVYFLIENHIKNNDQIIIDREYPGYEKLISKTLNLWIEKKLRKENISIAISQIGKKSRAHDLAWKELRAKIHRDTKKINSDKIIRFLETIKKSGSI